MQDGQKRQDALDLIRRNIETHGLHVYVVSGRGPRPVWVGPPDFYALIIVGRFEIARDLAIWISISPDMRVRGNSTPPYWLGLGGGGSHPVPEP